MILGKLKYKKPYMKFQNIIIAIALYIVALDANAQPNSSQKIKPEIVPNTVVVKLLSSSSLNIKGGRMGSTPFSKIFESVDIASFEPLFPNSTAHKCAPQNLNKSNNIDLSTIYVLKYSGDKDIQEIIYHLKKSGLVAYAEPQFVDHSLFTPNDPAAAPKTGRQYYLDVVKAYDAWDIEKGDSNMVVGIVDTDQNIAHEDLIGRTKINILDPINGKDDDKDGFIDNYRGWDIANNDNDVTAKQVIIPKKDTIGFDTLNGHSHGTRVFGFAGATVNNKIGIAGITYNNKMLPVKAMEDKDAATGIISNGYPGIVYAAEHGAKVINCSWGSYDSYAQLAQDVINYATFNYDALVVSAAGNLPVDQLLYPASYENVLCVASSNIDSTTKQDIKADYATYNHQVDISSPGVNMYSTYRDGYAQENGSSYASPTVAGAAGLVRAHFPKYTALQTLEQLRTTADDMSSVSANQPFAEKIGKGRLNIYRALTETKSPAVKMFSSDLPNNLNTFAYNGNTVKLKAYFRNYLAPTTNLKVTLRTLSPYIEMIDSTLTIGKLGTLDSIKNTNNPFVFKIKSNTPVNHNVEFRLGFEDGDYKDYQYFSGIFNPDFITLDTNQVMLTITSNGRIGFSNSESSQGLGFVYKTKNLLFESGLVITTSDKKISDCVRSAPISKNALSFQPIKPVSWVRNFFPGQETMSEFVDTSKARVGVKVVQNAYSSPTAPNNKFVIVRYLITNTTIATIDSMRVGLFTDLDIGISNRNRADFDLSSNLAYTYSSQIGSLYGGVSLLSDQAVSIFSFDHSSTVGGNNINPNDGFTDQEKNYTLSNGILRPMAGVAGLGNDVSQIIGGVFLNMQANETRQIAFAYIAGDNKADLINSANAAKIMYNKIIKPTSVELADNSMEVLLFPNPTKNILNVQLTNNSFEGIAIIENTIGSRIWEGEINSSNFSLNTESLPKGIYFLKLNLNDKIVVKKFLKE